MRDRSLQPHSSWAFPSGRLLLDGRKHRRLCELLGVVSVVRPMINAARVKLGSALTSRDAAIQDIFLGARLGACARGAARQGDGSSELSINPQTRNKRDDRL